MKKLIIRHYNACINRGVIGVYTSLFDFKEKIKEEYTELNDSLENDLKTDYKPKLSDETIQESIDVVMSNLNMLMYNGVDIEKEILKNTLIQEKRANETKDTLK